MGTVEQIRRLFWLEDGKANANTYLAMTAIAGLVGWAGTVVVVQFVHPLPSGVLTGKEVGAFLKWFGAVNGLSWPLFVFWVVVWFGRFGWAHLRVEEGGVMNLPNTIWAVTGGIAFALNAYGVWQTVAWPIWLPWAGAFAVSYVATAAMVERSGVYWVAGVLSTALFGYCLYVFFTASIPLGGTMIGSQVPSNAPPGLKNMVILPLPYYYAVLGALHVVPMLVDAYMGGRQLTDDDVPQVKAERMDDDTAGGVVGGD